VRTINGAEYVEVRLYQPLVVLPQRGEDGAIRYACTGVRPDDAALAFLFDSPELRDPDRGPLDARR